MPHSRIGVLLVNYGAVNFASRPVEWRYAGALAFVVLWGLGKVNETQVGIGRFLLQDGFALHAKQYRTGERAEIGSRAGRKHCSTPISVRGSFWRSRCTGI